MGVRNPFAPYSMSAKPLVRTSQQEPATSQDMQNLAEALAPAPLPEYEKKEGEREKTKTSESTKTRSYQTFNPQLRKTLEDAWLQEPSSQMQVISLQNLRNKIDAFNAQPNLDLTPLMQFGDLMTRGQYNLTERFKPAMTFSERQKLMNDMEKIYQDSVYDVQKAKNQWIDTQTKGFEEVNKEQVKELMNETGQIWRDTSSAMRNKKLSQAELDKVSGFDEVYNMLRYIEDQYYKTYENGWPSPSDMMDYRKAKIYAAQKIGKALEGKMTDEDFKRISGLIPEQAAWLGLGNAQKQFKQIYDLIGIGRDTYGSALETYRGQQLPLIKQTGKPSLSNYKKYWDEDGNFYPDGNPNYKPPTESTAKSSSTTKKKSSGKIKLPMGVEP